MLMLIILARNRDLFEEVYTFSVLPFRKGFKALFFKKIGPSFYLENDFLDYLPLNPPFTNLPLPLKINNSLINYFFSF